MVRLLTMFIEYNNETHLVLASLRPHENGFVGQLRWVDGNHHYFLFDTTVVFDGNGLVMQSVNKDFRCPPSLLSITMEAIKKQLQDTQQL